MQTGSRPLLRIPLTKGLPPPIIIPRSANNPTGAIAALTNFFLANPSNKRTVLLTGAGISVASGLADYRGTNGTYTLNKTYRPVYFNEFCASHEARKRYWARSFLGWTNLNKSRPNATHYAVKTLGDLGYVSSVITQSKCCITLLWKNRLMSMKIDVDSFHPQAHPSLPIIELHGYLRALVCLTCRNEYPRSEFQKQLASLNPSWEDFLAEMLKTGALDTEDPEERRKRGYRSNPDGDVEVPDAPYTTFRYPACPTCLAKPPSILPSGQKPHIEIDTDGAWKDSSNAGILKPAVIMFGESIPEPVKLAAENAIDEASRILVLGTSLATYSAWRLVKRAKERGMPIGVVNVGGIRGEEELFAGLSGANRGELGTRCSESTEKVLPTVLASLRNIMK